jgi:uncharacterized membrane protein YGL010W
MPEIARMSEPRPIDVLLAKYSESHLNHTNEIIHYVRLSIPFAAGMLVMSLVMLGVLSVLPPPTILPLSIAIFVLAWIGQFIGHKIEGKKPSFFDDVRFLLVGPLFVLSFLYRKLKLAY